MAASLSTAVPEFLRTKKTRINLHYLAGPEEQVFTMEMFLLKSDSIGMTRFL